MPIRLEGREEVRASFNRMKRGVRDISDTADPIARRIAKEVDMQIETAGRHFKTPWAPLKPAYLKWKIAQGFPRQTLVRTGDLRKSFVRPNQLIESRQPDRITIRSKDVKAAYHQYGTSNLPKRPILVMTRELQHQIRDIVSDHVFGDGRGKRYI